MVSQIRRNGAADPIECDAVAIGEIRRIRQVEHEGPCLRANRCEVTEVSASKRASKERKRRRHEAELYGELSRYYPRDEGTWGRPVLLRKGKHGEVFKAVATFH